MTQQKGVNAKLLLGFENMAYGTVAADGFLMPFNSCGVVASRAQNSPTTLTGTRNTVTPFAGNFNVAGPIVVPADSDAMAYWLYAMFGNPGTTGSDPYIHEFKVGSSMPSFSLEKIFEDLAANVYERLVGCKISTFSIIVGGDGELIMNMDILGANMTEETATFDGSPATISLDRINNFHAALTEGESPISNATEVALNVDFGLDADNYLIGGGGIRGDIPEGLVTVTGNLKTIFEDKTLLEKALNEDESGLKITLTASASSILEFEIQELKYSVNGIPVDGPQGLIVSLDYVGYYKDASEASNIVARVTNKVDSYTFEASPSLSPSASESPSPSPSESPSESPSVSPS